MDEEEVIKIGMEVALKPVTDIAGDILGLAGGDWLREMRERNREKLRRRTEEITRQRDVRNLEEVSPSIAIPLLEAAQDEARDELQDMWARLLAATVDPARKRLYRREFVSIVRDLEPIDTLVLPQLLPEGVLSPMRAAFVAKALGVGQDEILNSFRNLVRLDLADEPSGLTFERKPRVTALGRQLLAAVND